MADEAKQKRETRKQRAERNGQTVEWIEFKRADDTWQALPAYPIDPSTGKKLSAVKKQEAGGEQKQEQKSDAGGVSVAAVVGGALLLVGAGVAGWFFLGKKQSQGAQVHQLRAVS